MALYPDDQEDMIVSHVISIIKAKVKSRRYVWEISVQTEGKYNLNSSLMTRQLWMNQKLLAYLLNRTV